MYTGHPSSIIGLLVCPETSPYIGLLLPESYHPQGYSLLGILYRFKIQIGLWQNQKEIKYVGT